MNKLLLLLLLVCFRLLADTTTDGKEINLISRSQVQLPEPALASADWQWLRHKRTLIFGTSAPNYPPYDITTGLHDYGGINADYLGILAYNLNVQVKVRSYSTYAALLKALKNGEVDLIGNVSADDGERDSILLTQPYQPITPALVVRTDSLLQSKPPAHIAVEQSYNSRKILAEHFPGVDVQVFDSPRRALEALSFSNIDAFIGDATSAQYLINQANLNNLHLQLLPQKEADGFSFGLAQNNLRLQRIINTLLPTIPESTTAAINSRWNGGSPLASSGTQLLFTALERKWIEEHPSIQVAVNDDFAPLGFFDEQGSFRGLTADVLEAIASRTGLRFNIIRTQSLLHSLEAVKNKQADVVAGVTLDSVWLNGLLTTRSYLFNSWVLVGYKSQKDNLHPQRIAVVEGHSLSTALQQQYPQSRSVSVATSQEGMTALKEHRADALILPMIGASFLLSLEPQSGLAILHGLDTEPARFVMGISRDEYPLATILDKALLNIPPEEIHSMTSNWYSYAYLTKGVFRDEDRFAEYYRPLLLVLALVVLLLLWAIWHYRQNYRQRLARQAASAGYRQQALLDALPVPIYITDFSERVVAANAQFYRALGAPAEQVLGEKLDHYQLNISGAQEVELKPGDNEPQAFLITRQLELDGKIRLLQQWRSLLMADPRQAEGNVSGWFDITEREQLIGQLQQAKELADSANRAKTTFLATMSHEIRTPLNAIIGLLELTLRQHQQGTQPDANLLGVAYDSANSLLALIGDILDISRIESDRLVLQPERAELRHLIEAVAMLFDGVARQKGLDFKLGIDAAMTGDVLIDPLRFKQVLSNLVSNAIKFTSQGQVTLHAMVESASDERMDISIRVIDSGQGMDENLQKRLFQPFSQGKTTSGGTGLGLYICRTLVEMMGGTISLRSQPEIGSEVTVSLSIPRLTKLKLTIASTSVSHEPLPSLRVLVAEDHRAGRMLLLQQLTYLGHRVVTAEDGKQALNILEQQQFDLIMTDCHMPNMDGYSFVRQLRKIEKQRQHEPMTIWGMTANAQGSARDACLEAGMDDCLFKPVSLQILTDKLRSLPVANVEHNDDDDDDIFSPEKLPAELRQPAVFAEFIATLLDCLQEDGAALAKEAEHQPLRSEDVSELAHKLAGAARLIHADKLDKACRVLEENVEHGNIAPVIVETRRLIVTLQNLQRTTSV